ncbi:3325_t:CDS:2, partial [Acaulospora morrowiae]
MAEGNRINRSQLKKDLPTNMPIETTTSHPTTPSRNPTSSNKTLPTVDKKTNHNTNVRYNMELSILIHTTDSIKL